jgi:hypothetical protein
MHRSSLVLLASMALLASSARADEAAPATGTAVSTGTSLSALLPLGPLGRDALGATDSGGGSILMSAVYGGLAGAIVGLGVGLIESDNYGRDVAIGAGVGILVGAALGAAHAFGDTRAVSATDGLNTTERYPVFASARTVTLGRRF